MDDNVSEKIYVRQNRSTTLQRGKTFWTERSSNSDTILSGSFACEQ